MGRPFFYGFALCTAAACAVALSAARPIEHATPDRIAEDRRAAQLAYDAARGDTTALHLLKLGAAANNPALIYGLAKFSLSPEPPAFTPLIDEFEDQNYPALRQVHTATAALQADSAAAHRNEDARSALAMLKAAANMGDAAAQADLAKEYWAEAVRLAVLMSATTPNSTNDPTSVFSTTDGRIELRIATWACDKSKSWLAQSMLQGWPESFAQAGVMNSSTTSDVLMRASGCLSDGPDYANQMWQKAAGLGSAEATWVLRENSAQAGQVQKAIFWAEKLKALADAGDHEARDLETTTAN